MSPFLWSFPLANKNNYFHYFIYATIRIYDITTLISGIWKITFSIEIKISDIILTNSRLVVIGEGEKGWIGQFSEEIL